MSIKRDILARINIVFISLCVFAFAIIAQGFRVTVLEGEQWRKRGEQTSRIDTIQGERGNIFSEDGRLLATSLPFFDIYMDMTIPHDTVIAQELDQLAANLSSYFKSESKGYYKKRLLKGRAQDNRYLLVKRNISYSDLPAIKKWPIFKHGRYRGGIILKRKNQRVRPFGNLAKRTIGYTREQGQVGLEGEYDGFLRGSKAAQSQQLIKNVWYPVYEEQDLDIKNGSDLYTTINVDMQDVVENALQKALKKHSADFGCAVIMEVSTGKVKAIANLQKGIGGGYYETYNHAIGTKNEPGSTIKIAALTALLEDGYADENTIVDIEEGKKMYYDVEMKDSKWHHESEITLAKVIEISSNVGISKLVDEHYREQPQKFVSRLDRMHLTQPTGIAIKGERMPVVKNPGDKKEWTGITLTQMSIGYELEFTPLQILTFFNAIANNGKMMQPYLVSDVKDLDETTKHFDPVVLKRQICKTRTAKTIQKMLQQVVEGPHGTAKHIRSDKITMACKTGTAKIAKDSKGYDTVYQASIAGFFPAENPVYSCIVVVNQPKEGSYYGGAVAGPVFKEIAEKCYSGSIESHEAINKKERMIAMAAALPITNHGHQQDLKNIFNTLGMMSAPSSGDEWVVPQSHEKYIEMKQLKVIDNLIPNVTGMGLRDAIYILENHGLKVRFKGYGRVTNQEPAYGVQFAKGTIVNLELE